MVQRQYLTDKNTDKITFFRKPQNASKIIYFDHEASVSEFGWQKVQNSMIEQEFDRALKEQEFLVYYQPKMNSVTEEVCGAEALIRWQRKDGSLVPPSEFVPLYEENGLIKELDEYVFRQVCRYQRMCMEQNKELLPISVNLSRVSIMDTELAERYGRIMMAYGIPFSCVPIEITESADIYSQQISETAKKMIQSGFSLHVDDFGTGYSSLASLDNIPFTTLKIDKQLIDKLDQPRGRVVVEQIVRLAHLLDMNVVAEGVESREQLELLKQMDCCEIQGYYYARPMPISEFEQFMSEKSENTDNLK